jgi:hypothetical protein
MTKNELETLVYVMLSCCTILDQSFYSGRKIPKATYRKLARRLHSALEPAIAELTANFTPKGREL